jgi:hypothetical protein
LTSTGISAVDGCSEILQLDFPNSALEMVLELVLLLLVRQMFMQRAFWDQLSCNNNAYPLGSKACIFSGPGPLH